MQDKIQSGADYPIVLSSVKVLRKLHIQELARVNEYDSTCLFESKLVELLITLLAHTDLPELLLEICWILTNLASCEQGEVEALLAIPDTLTRLNNIVRIPLPKFTGDVMVDTPLRRSIQLMKAQALQSIGNLAAHKGTASDGRSVKTLIAQGGFYVAIATFLEEHECEAFEECFDAQLMFVLNHLFEETAEISAEAFEPIARVFSRNLCRCSESK